MRRVMLGAAVAAATVIGAAAWERRLRTRNPAPRAPGREVGVRPRRVWVHESGPAHTDRPTVVLLTGAGDQAASWVLVRRRLSESFRVFGYDRVGMGGSDDRPGPRTLAGYVDELAEVVAAAQISGPVLLVGHSFGGLIAQTFAAADPNRVVGLVLVDAVSPAITSSWVLRIGVAMNVAAARVLTALAPLGISRALFALHAMPLYPEQHLLRAASSAEEYRRWVGMMCVGFAGNAAREVAAVRPGAGESPEPPIPFGGPVTVIHSHLLGTAWDTMQEDLEVRHPGSVRIATGDHFHNIHLSHPDLIVDAVCRQLATRNRG